MTGTSTLEKLLPTLATIPADEVESPNLPIEVALQEAHDLNALVANPEIRERLIAVGLPNAELTALPRAIAAAREAQSAWIVVRDRTKNDAQREREDRGIKLRADLVAAARWNLRDDRVAQATLDAIQEGEGVEDLVQDLLDVAALIEQRADAFEADETLDTDESIALARAAAKDIRAGLSAARLARSQEDAKDTRDRAYTYLAARVGAVRSAGRYAFRGTATMQAKFGSAYLRATERKRARKKQVPVESEPASAAEPSTPGSSGASV